MKNTAHGMRRVSKVYLKQQKKVTQCHGEELIMWQNATEGAVI